MAEVSTPITTEVPFVQTGTDVSPGTTPEDLNMRGSGGEAVIPQQLVNVGKENRPSGGLRGWVNKNILGRSPQEPRNTDGSGMDRRAALKAGLGLAASAAAGGVGEGFLGIGIKEATPATSLQRGLAVEYAVVDSLAGGQDFVPKNEIVQLGWSLSEPIRTPDADVQMTLGSRQEGSSIITGLFVSPDNGDRNMLVAEGVKPGDIRFVGGDQDSKQIAVIRRGDPYDPNSRNHLSVFQAAAGGVMRTADILLPTGMNLSLTDPMGNEAYQIEATGRGRQLVLDQPPAPSNNFTQGVEPKPQQPIVVPLGL